MEDLPHLPKPAELVAFLQQVDACFDVADLRRFHEDHWITDCFVDLEHVHAAITTPSKLFGFASRKRGRLRITHQLFEQSEAEVVRPIGSVWLSQWMFESSAAIMRATISWDMIAQDPYDRGSAVLNHEFLNGQYAELTRYLSREELQALGAIAVEIGCRTVPAAGA